MLAASTHPDTQIRLRVAERALLKGEKSSNCFETQVCNEAENITVVASLPPKIIMTFPVTPGLMSVPKGWYKTSMALQINAYFNTGVLDVTKRAQ